MLNVAETLKDRRLLFLGATGFVGKVALSMLLERYPEIGRIFVLVRPGAGSTSEQRFFHKVVRSPVFDPVRQRWGEGTDAFLREKIAPLPGDAARPDLNFGPEDFARFGKLDAIVNCAGLVSFTPALDTALRINTMGVRFVRDVARKTGAGVIHISTCFVAGNRDGDIWEDESLDGYYPRRGELRDEDFHVDAEIADCERLIAQVKELADDRAHISMFRDRAARRLESEGRDPDDEHTLKLAVARERKRWVAERLTELGMERAQHWGWPNIYTYTKSLGDQVLAAAKDVNYALVRPSIVETSVAYPFRGWNEGFTTSAPLAFLIMKGHRTIAGHPKANLDVVPVDLLAATIVGATAAVIAGTNKHVYQASTSDTVPFPVPRAIELTALYTRRFWKEKETGSELVNRLRARLESVPRQKEIFERISAPAWKSLAERADRALDRVAPRWGAPRLAELVEDTRKKLDEVRRITSQTTDLFTLFMPFIHDRHYVFRSDNVRELFASMSVEDRQKLSWDPEAIDWREYWLENHMPALKRWIFPDLEDEFKAKPRTVYTYKHLIELFDATCKLHKSRVAFRLLPPPGSDEPIRRYTFRQVHESASLAAAILRDAGVSAGERVLLASENRPEWAIAYFGVLKAGGTVVPVDHQAGADELVNIAKSAGAKALILSERVRERIPELHDRLVKAKQVAALLGYDDLFLGEPKSAPGAVAASPKGDDLASLIFTSGTTGTPKGVMLTHKNFTSLLSKVVAVFDFNRNDKMLSVLPLHHTFEFTCGLLAPLMMGAQVTYLHEVDADNLNAAFEEGEITVMIGVPALWQLLHRKIFKALADKNPWFEEVFGVAVEGARRFRDKTGLNLGKLAFWPVQKKLGGRIRLMVSGGSALPPDVMKAFQGLGFSLYEGYGLTEAAPVLTVSRPGQKVIPGSVGPALPGIEVKIHEPNAEGVGEVVASGPNVMLGYWENPDATGEVIRDGYLHTGDLGRIDEEGRLTIVGRKKEMILAANGENVYPDELEELYADSSLVKELSIVGLPEETGSGELVACLLVPEYGERPRQEVRDKLLEHVKQVSARLPHYKRVKVMHLWDHELPRTATRKVKRKLVVEELKKLQRAARTAESAARSGPAEDWLVEVIAQVSGRPKARIAAETRLEELGFDSLMYTELGVALEAAGVQVDESENLQGIGTVADLAELVASRRKRARAQATIVRKRPRAKASEAAADDLPVWPTLATIGRKLLTWGQRLTYERVFATEVTGRAYLPQRAPFIVAANHASHLDMGLVKHALGDWGSHLVALAAKDYFFEDRLKRAYFENFTNLVPMDRHGSLRESLRLASRVLEAGHILLIFPEGTRSESGIMADFKASIGYLSLTNEVDVVPMYLAGTHDALPKGAAWPRERKIAAHIGPVLSFRKLQAATQGMPKSEQYREAARLVEAAVRKLAGLPAPPRRLLGSPEAEA